MKLILHALMLPLLFISLFVQGQSLIVYDVKDHRSKTGEGTAFISLSEDYRLNEHPDSLAVPYEHLGRKGQDEPGYFELTGDFRRRCLGKTKIAESDNLYIYDYAQNLEVTVRIADLSIVAILNHYQEASSLVRQSDYMIGFEIEGELLEGFGEHFPHTLAYVGKEDPFVKQKMYPMIWERVDASLFPAHENKDNTGLQLPAFVIGETYRFQHGDLIYFFQDKLWKNEVSARRLMVVSSIDHSVLYNRLYYNGESGSFAPLHLVDEDKLNQTFQWTGTLFKDKSTVFLGLTFFSFGCPQIHFVDLIEPSLQIRCDNRH